MNRWFGKKSLAKQNPKMCLPEVLTPTGAICCKCDEPITEDDNGVQYDSDHYAHQQCHEAMVMALFPETKYPVN